MPSLPIPRIRHSEIVSFFNNSMLLETNDCILWPYAKSKGYGVIRKEGKNITVTRLALITKIGKPPTLKHFALHKPEVCHNPTCFNYKHLRWGTQSENMADKYYDNTVLRGESVKSSKLTEIQAISIRLDPRKQKTIAKEYNLSKGTISMIKSGKRWSHLK